MIKRLSLIIFFSLLIPLFAQVTPVSAADTPLTSPVTAPQHSFTLSGKVTYKQLGRLMGNMQRFMPAKDVLVTIVNFFDSSKKYTTTTDVNGAYGVNVPPGLYQIMVSDNKHTFFVPPLRVERVNNANTHRTANFEGLVFPHF